MIICMPRGLVFLGADHYRLACLMFYTCIVSNYWSSILVIAVEDVGDTDDEAANKNQKQCRFGTAAAQLVAGSVHLFLRELHPDTEVCIPTGTSRTLLIGVWCE